MDTYKDDGHPKTVYQAYVLVVLATVVLCSCHKPSSTALKPSKDSAAILTSEAVKKKVVKKKSKKKKLYLTFDDGPNRGTKNVLDIIKDEDIAVSFFVVGEHVFASEWQKSLWDSLKATEDIELCNHSYSHANGRYSKYYQDPEAVVKDFQRTKDSLQLTNGIARTPGRNIWRMDSLNYTDLAKSAPAADSLEKAGFNLMGWDLEWHYDPKSMSVTFTADKMVEQIDSVFARKRSKREGHLVLLAHDQVYQKADDSIQLRQFFQLLKLKDDYELTLVTDYPTTTKVQ